MADKMVGVSMLKIKNLKSGNKLTANIELDGNVGFTLEVNLEDAPELEKYANVFANAIMDFAKKRLEQ